MHALTEAAVLLIHAVFGAALFIAVLRVLLQLVRANFYNPICQALFRLTNPVIMPLQRLIPNWRHLNLAGTLLAGLLAVTWMALLNALSPAPVGGLGVLLLGMAQLVAFGTQTVFWITLLGVLLTWFSPDARNPAIPLIVAISEALLKPARRFIPPLGGIDFSPMAVLLALQLVLILVVAPLRQLALSF